MDPIASATCDVVPNPKPVHDASAQPTAVHVQIGLKSHAKEASTSATVARSKQHAQPSPHAAQQAAAKIHLSPTPPAGTKPQQAPDTCVLCTGDVHQEIEHASATTQSSDASRAETHTSAEHVIATEAASPAHASGTVAPHKLHSGVQAVELHRPRASTAPSPIRPPAATATKDVGTVHSAPAEGMVPTADEEFERGGTMARSVAHVPTPAGPSPAMTPRSRHERSGTDRRDDHAQQDAEDHAEDPHSQQARAGDKDQVDRCVDEAAAEPETHVGRQGRPVRVRRKSAKAADALSVRFAMASVEGRRRSDSDYVPPDVSGSSAGGVEALCDSEREAGKETQVRKKRGRPRKHVEVDSGKKRGRPKLIASTSDSDADTPTMRSVGRGLVGRKSKAHTSASLVKGIYHKELANAYEAQLALEPYRKLLKATGQPGLEDSQTQYYLGLFKYVVDKPGDKMAAMDMATRAIDRVILKVLEGKLPDNEVDRLLNFNLKDYRDPDDEHMRSVLTAREYVTQMMISGFQRLHAAEGSHERSRLGVYPKKSRKDGVVRTWEARVTQSGIKSFSTYPTLEEAQQAYDLGIILLYGTHKRLNNLLTTYYAHGRFLPSIVIPQAVASSVALHIDYVRKVDDDEKTNNSLQMMRRVCGYFGDGAQLPLAFQQYPLFVAANQHILDGDDGNAGVVDDES